MQEDIDRLMKALAQEPDGFSQFEAVVKKINTRWPKKAEQEVFWRTLSLLKIFQDGRPEQSLPGKHGILCELASRPEEKYIKAMKSLLQQGVSANENKSVSLGNFCMQPLYYAVNSQNLRGVKLLLAHGAINSDYFFYCVSGNIGVMHELALDLLLKEMWPVLMTLPHAAIEINNVRQAGIALARAIFCHKENKDQETLKSLRLALNCDPMFVEEFFTRLKSMPLSLRYRHHDIAPSLKRAVMSMHLLFRRRDNVVSQLPKPILHMVCEMVCERTLEFSLPVLLEQAKKDPNTDAAFLEKRKPPRPK